LSAFHFNTVHNSVLTEGFNNLIEKEICLFLLEIKYMIHKKDQHQQGYMLHYEIVYSIGISTKTVRIYSLESNGAQTLV
jgi:hypothetical protein